MKKVVLFSLLVALLVNITACGIIPSNSMGEDNDVSPPISPPPSPVPTITPAPPSFDITASSVIYPDIDGLEYSDLNGMEFWFGSGAGAWCTTVQIMPDGTFSGQYRDDDMGGSGSDHPHGTAYECYFSGNFTSLRKTGDFEYSMKCESLNIKGTVDEEKIIDGVKVITTTPYGFDDADEFFLYLPGKKTSELSEAFLSWAHNRAEDLLVTYGLYNAGGEQGFIVWHNEDSLKDWVGAYEFSEAVEYIEGVTIPMVMNYNITVYEENGGCFADIEIFGQTTNAKAKAKIYGTSSRISLILDAVLPDSFGGFWPQKIGSLMVSFSKEDQDIYTYWGAIQPMLPENEESDRIYFKKV